MALTVHEAAELLGCSDWLVRKAVKNGVLPVVHPSLAGRRVLIPATAFKDAIGDLTVMRRDGVPSTADGDYPCG